LIYHHCESSHKKCLSSSLSTQNAILSKLPYSKTINELYIIYWDRLLFLFIKLHVNNLWRIYEYIISFHQPRVLISHCKLWARETLWNHDISSSSKNCKIYHILSIDIFFFFLNLNFIIFLDRKLLQVQDSTLLTLSFIILCLNISHSSV
jgi:hypothetical protein